MDFQGLVCKMTLSFSVFVASAGFVAAAKKRTAASEMALSLVRASDKKCKVSGGRVDPFLDLDVEIYESSLCGAAGIPELADIRGEVP